MEASRTRSSKTLGRPRAFSEQEALDAATRVFQRQGYEGASLNDLTAAMGINRPSCYAAFGDKEALFLKVLERYTEQAAKLYREAFAQPTAHAVASYLLHHTLAVITSNTQDACLFALPFVHSDQPGEALRASRQALERSLKRRFKRARRAGDLPPTADADALASLLSMTLRGLAGQAAEGVSRACLVAQAETLLQLFPVKHVP